MLLYIGCAADVHGRQGAVVTRYPATFDSTTTVHVEQQMLYLKVISTPFIACGSTVLCRGALTMRQNIYRPPDESLATDILELLCGLTQFLPLCVFGLLLLQYNLLDARTYGLPLLLLVSGTVAHV